MDLRHLRYFVAVAEELHFGRAARRLNMSQPPLSQQIKELEEQLQASLLRRTSRSVELTFAGRVILERARRILDDVEQLKNAARRAESGQIGELAGGFINSAGYSILPPSIRHFRETHPEVVVRLWELTGFEQTEHLRSRRIDVGFVRGLPASGGIKSEVILREPFILAFPEGHPALAQSEVSLAELKDENFINFPRGNAPAYHEAIIRLCTTAGFVPRIAQEANTIHSAFVFVRAGIGIAILPASALQMRAQGVVFRLPTEAEPKAEMVLAWRSDNTSPVLARFVRAAREGALQYQRNQKGLIAVMTRGDADGDETRFSEVSVNHRG